MQQLGRIVHRVALTCSAFWLAALAVPGQAAVIADFGNDFQANTPKAGWSYEWNSGGAIGTQANYSALSADTLNGSPSYDVTPGTFPSGAPASYTVVLKSFMHPGQGVSQSGLEHFTIAAFTLPAGGVASVDNLTVTDGDPSGGDGVDIFVGVNNGGSIVGSYANGGSFSAASLPLGTLNAGDTIYVGIGSKDNDGNDSTNLNYQVSLTPVPEPGTLGLFGLGAAGILVAARRRRLG